jgi:hypothetical protein
MARPSGGSAESAISSSVTAGVSSLVRRPIFMGFLLRSSSALFQKRTGGLSGILRACGAAGAPGARSPRALPNDVARLPDGAPLAPGRFDPRDLGKHFSVIDGAVLGAHAAQSGRRMRRCPIAKLCRKVEGPESFRDEHFGPICRGFYRVSAHRPKFADCGKKSRRWLQTRFFEAPADSAEPPLGRAISAHHPGFDLPMRD